MRSPPSPTFGGSLDWRDRRASVDTVGPTIGGLCDALRDPLFRVEADLCRCDGKTFSNRRGTEFAPCRSMSSQPAEYVAVTFSSQPSVAYFLKGVLDCAGFMSVASSSVDELDLLLQQVRASVLVYDLSYPFQENWRALQRLRRSTVLQHLPVVITTSEAPALYQALGIAADVEIFRRPDDVTELRRIVRQTIDAAVHAA